MQGVSRLILLLCSLMLLVAGLVNAQAEHHAAPVSATAAAVTPPKAKIEVAEETIHGVKIVDSYRWLENADSPEAQEFVRQQLGHTRSVLDRQPGRAAIHARLTELLQIGTVGTPRVGGNFYAHTRREGTQDQPVLYVREGSNGKDRVLLDPNKLSADGTVALDWWEITDDGKYVTYGVSPSGSEMSTLHIIETATGKQLPDTIERTRYASVAWLPDNSGFYYTRYPKKGDVPAGQENYNRHVFFHKLGTDPAKDPKIFGQGRDPRDMTSVDLSEDGRWLLIHVSQGWAKSELYLRDLKSNGPLVTVAAGKDFLYSGRVYKGTLYISSNEDAPRFRLFKVSAEHPERANWKEIIPQSADARGPVMKEFRIIGGRLVVEFEHNAHSQLRGYDLDGKHLVDLALPSIGSITGIGGKHDSREVFYGFESFTAPPHIFTVPVVKLKASAARLEGTVWDKVNAPGVDPNAYQVEQVFYPSKDGTRVPMFLIAKKGLVKNGHNPTLLTGYGGFNISMTPSFRRGSFLWLEHGGVLAVANLRGGAEYGEDWHRAGMLANKQNVFDDFIAAAEFLIREKFTDKEHLAIQGGSNGGLLVGAAMTQRPDLFKAVVCQVPLLDMLRYQNFQIARLWIAEYGSAEDPEQFKWLYAYSPYHRVKEGTLYPATLLMTADSDSRVDPMHAKKMAALLQAKAANGPDRPILLRIETKAGHGAGKPVSKLIEEATDMYSFLFWQLGVK
ncbi:MAG: prolyl oligopeptidase family protein [Terriglobales bacterium]